MRSTYTVVDLIKAMERADAKGPKAAAAFRAALNAASRRYLNGDETIEEAMFGLIEDVAASKKSN